MAWQLTVNSKKQLFENYFPVPIGKQPTAILKQGSRCRQSGGRVDRLEAYRTSSRNSLPAQQVVIPPMKPTRPGYRHRLP